MKIDGVHIRHCEWLRYFAEKRNQVDVSTIHLPNGWVICLDCREFLQVILNKGETK